MRPLRASVGLTAALTAAGVFATWFYLDYLRPFWMAIFRDYWLPLAFYAGSAIFTLWAILYTVHRKIGLADLGRRTDLIDRGIRRGEGDRELAAALERDKEGTWE